MLCIGVIASTDNRITILGAARNDRIFAEHLVTESQKQLTAENRLDMQLLGLLGIW